MMEMQNHLMSVLMVVFILSWLIQLGYYLIVFIRFSFHAVKKVSNDRQPVSVIICARNEVNNLRKYLAPVLEQDYPAFEVIVVNDCSWDESGHFLEEMRLRYPHLKI